jgi:hypothetical protein
MDAGEPGEELKAFEAFVRADEQSLAAQPAPVQPVALKVIKGELCYKSHEDDQSFGMWIPVTQEIDLPFVNDAEFYTTPPAAQRAWLGLTDECRKQMIQEGWREYIAGIDDGKTFGEWMSVATEAKLKEKNT